MSRYFILVIFAFFCLSGLRAQVDEDQMGSWYMLIWNKKFNNSQFGLQGDYQFRYWDFGSDLEQILLRTGVTYRPENANVLFTLGYANITSGAFGDSDDKVTENRIYQEALLPHKVSDRFRLTHRFRYEQRWVENQYFRTRYRYNLFVNIPLTSKEMVKKTVYAALYNEIFINGQRVIGDGKRVELFDRNRIYLGLGYYLLDNLRFQAGWMKQTTNNWEKRQAQWSVLYAW